MGYQKAMLNRDVGLKEINIVTKDNSSLEPFKVVDIMSMASKSLRENIINLYMRRFANDLRNNFKTIDSIYFKLSKYETRDLAKLNIFLKEENFNQIEKIIYKLDELYRKFSDVYIDYMIYSDTQKKTYSKNLDKIA